MILSKFTEDDLLAVARELGLKLNSRLRKHEIREDILQGMFEPDEIEGVCEKIRSLEREHIRALEREDEQIELEMKGIAVEGQRLLAVNSGTGASTDQKGDINMTKLLQPFRVGENIGHYLVNLEICVKQVFRKDT